MTYQFATGFNNAAGLANVAKQPKSSPIRPGRLRSAGDRSKVADGDLMQQWIFTQISGSEFSSMMTTFGIDIADWSPASVNCTIKTLKNDRATFANYNAVLSLDGSVYGLNFLGPENVIIHLQITGTAT